MATRPTWQGYLRLSLVSCPVGLYTATSRGGEVHFNMLHKDCGTKLKQQYICPKHETIVDRENTVKGREFAKGQYVTFTPEELKALDEKATNSIDVLQFIPLAAVDRLYLEKAYYLGPGKGGDKAYRLLTEALKKTGRAGLGQYAARGRQHLVLLRPRGDVLVMEQLYYKDELRSPSEVPLGEGEVKPAELNLAKQIIEQGATDEFHPERYHDQVRERVMEAINQKVEGQEITAEPVREGGGKIIDLMEALKASLAKSEPEEKAPEKKKKRKAS